MSQVYFVFVFFRQVLISPPLPVTCAQIRALVCLPPLTGVFVAMCCAIAAGQEYMRRRAAMEQFLVALALERSQREHAAAVERRRAAVESAERFEKSFGYICELLQLHVRRPVHL